MPGLKKLFEEAYAVWREKKPDEKPKKGNPTYDFFMRLQGPFQSQLINIGFPDLKVKVSVGMMGKFTQTPWIGFRDDDITDNFEEGVFVVYIFAPDYGNLYLTIIQGVTNFRSRQIEESVAKLRKQIPKPDGFTVGVDGSFAKDAPLDSSPDKYKRGTLYSKKYRFKMLPEDEELEKDLKAALVVYGDFASGKG